MNAPTKQNQSGKLNTINKNLNKIFHWIISPYALGLVVTAATTFTCFQYYQTADISPNDLNSGIIRFLRELHQRSIDFRLRLRGPTAGEESVGILAVDEQAIEQEGRWPWPREKVAQVVDRAIELGASVIAFDMIFSEADQNSSIPTLNRLRRQLISQKQITPEIQTYFSDEIIKANSDKKFADIIKKRADHLVMGAFFEEIKRTEYTNISPYADSCLDVLFERSQVGQYWSLDQKKPKINDPFAQEQILPAPIKENLLSYFHLLEASSLDNWLAQNPKPRDAILQGLTLLGEKEDFPILDVLAADLSNEPELATAAVEAVYGSTPDPERMDTILDLIRQTFTTKDRAILQSNLRLSTESYCYRFLNENNKNAKLNDELLSVEKFNQIYDKTGLDGQFEALGWEKVWERANQAGVELPTGQFRKYYDTLKKTSAHNFITSIGRWMVNIPLLGKQTQYTGYFNADLDSDGSIRQNMLIAHRGNHYASSLALKAFMLAKKLNVSGEVVRGENDPLQKFLDTKKFLLSQENPGKAFELPVDPTGRLMINYSGPQYSFPHISAADILNDSDKIKIRLRHKDPHSNTILDTMEVDKKAFLKDKVLFFGATATGIYDLRVTPFEENFPGVETHANMLSNLLVEYARANGQADRVQGLPGFLKTNLKQEASIMPTLLAIIGLVLTFLLSYFGSIAGLGVILTFTAVIAICDRFFLFGQGHVVAIFWPLSMVGTNFICLTFYKYFTEERKKRELKGTFQKYVSPAIVNEILSDPTNIELGGKKMNLTVLFSDVRGFTTISEKLDPRALSDLLNSYLTPMTNLVFDHKGTLDKYMGDAIMAFWGAPIHFEDHAAHAARCALAMLKKLKELQEEYRAKGLPEIDIGIGLNSGEMSVGNMGSNTVRSYTVMGDAVNLGSRLEGINKQYGTRIIISEFTYAAIQKDFIAREIDWVRVKGKALPVRIYELIAEKSVPEKTVQMLEQFRLGFDCYHKKDWEQGLVHFRKALEIQPDDAASELYIERIEEYKETPPDENWDGVYTMKTK